MWLVIMWLTRADRLCFTPLPRNEALPGASPRSAGLVVAIVTHKRHPVPVEELVPYSAAISGHPWIPTAHYSQLINVNIIFHNYVLPLHYSQLK